MGLLKYAIVRNIYFLPVFILSILKGLFILLTVLVFRGPSWVFKRRKREDRPDCMNNPLLGTHRFIKLKDLTLHVIESGDSSKPLMLFIHGFPECWYSWRYQIQQFNKDFHCVAFDMRGVGESDAPPGMDNYTLDKLTCDVCEIIEAVGHKSCILVGHDWGGFVAWEFAARYPDMVTTFIPMNIPHPDRMSKLISSYLPQIWMSWYIFFFQLPVLPEILVNMGDYAIIKGACKKGPATDDDVEAFKFALSQPGRVTTFLNYYRNILSQIFTETGKVRAPTLLIWGTGDSALHVKLSYGTEKFCPNLTVERIEGGDHFIQQEQPDVVNELMRKFLEK